MSVLEVPSTLAACEEVIERGLQSFVEVGQALVTIRDGKLYRASYPSFEAYCQHRWGFTRVRAHQLISGAETTEALRILNSPLPANEGQAAQLHGLPPEDAAEVMAEAAESGKVTAASIREVRERIAPATDEPAKANGAHVGRSSGEIEWYTPNAYVDAARTVMGAIDLDPASTADANQVVQAAQFYTAEDDGLAQPWKGRVWLNPPYANALITAFCDRLVAGYRDGDVSEACVLTNNATETRWFQTVAAAAIAVCFPQGRIRFWYPDRGSFTPLQGQAIFYLGASSTRFAEQFRQFGLVLAVHT